MGNNRRVWEALKPSAMQHFHNPPARRVVCSTVAISAGVRVFSITQLEQILADHTRWLRGEVGGVRADLSNCNLTRANLNGANFTNANLTRANLNGANLTCAILTRAILNGADLTRANLTCANLYGANLTDAILNGAILTRAILTRAVTTNALGLILPRANTDLDYSIPERWLFAHGSSIPSEGRRLRPQECCERIRTGSACTAPATVGFLCSLYRPERIAHAYRQFCSEHIQLALRDTVYYISLLLEPPTVALVVHQRNDNFRRIHSVAELPE